MTIPRKPKGSKFIYDPRAKKSSKPQVGYAGIDRDLLEAAKRPRGAYFESIRISQAKLFECTIAHLEHLWKNDEYARTIVYNFKKWMRIRRRSSFNDVFDRPALVEEYTENYRAKMALAREPRSLSLETWFAAQCVVAKHGWTSQRLAYRRYVAWCQAQRETPCHCAQMVPFLKRREGISRAYHPSGHPIYLKLRVNEATSNVCVFPNLGIRNLRDTG